MQNLVGIAASKLRQVGISKPFANIKTGGESFKELATENALDFLKRPYIIIIMVPHD